MPSNVLGSGDIIVRRQMWSVFMEFKCAGKEIEKAFFEEVIIK